MFCSRCGESILAGSRFCPECGAAVGRAPTSLMARPWPVTLLAWINFVAALFSVAGAVASLGLDRTGWAMLLLVWSGVSVACGIGLWKLRPWGRTLQLAKAWIGLIAFPLGTLLSILILIYLMPRRSKVLFSGRTVEQLSPEEIGLLQQPTASAVALVVVGVAGVVAVLFAGIVASIAIPNLLNAIDRGKQKRTTMDIRVLAQAVEAYAVDHNHYPLACELEELVPVVEPAYIKTVPRTDGWGQPLRYECLVDEDYEVAGYGILSPGKDGRWEFDGLERYAGGETVDFDCDILFLDGTFYQWPAGTL